MKQITNRIDLRLSDLALSSFVRILRDLEEEEQRTINKSKLASYLLVQGMKAYFDKDKEEIGAALI